MKRINVTFVVATLLSSSLAPYVAAEPKEIEYEVKNVFVNLSGEIFVFPARELANLLAEGKRITHIETNTGHVITIQNYTKQMDISYSTEITDILSELIQEKKYLSKREIEKLHIKYDGSVDVDEENGDITIIGPPVKPKPIPQSIIISDILLMQDVPNAVTIKFSKPPKNIEALITGEFIELEHNGEVFLLMYARSGVYDNEAIFRVVDGKRLHNNVSYNVTIAGDWAETTIKNVTIKNETPFVERIEGPSTVDASIVVNGKFDYAELRYAGVTQYGDTTELPSTTVLEKVVLDGKALATSDYTFRGGVLTLKNKLMPKSTIETTFSFKVKGRTERTTLTTTVNDFAPAEAARVELALDTTKPFYEGQDMTVKAKVFDQYGEEMKTAQVDWQVGSLQLTGGLTEKVTLQNSGSVVVTATVNGHTASQTITVLAAPKPAKIEVAVTPGNYFNGDDLPVTANVFDQHGTEMRNQKVDWTVGDAKKLAGNQSDVLTLQNEGDVKITAKIGEVTGEQVVKVKPTPTLMKIESAPISFAAGDTDAIYAPLVFTNTKGVEMKLNDVDINKLKVDKGELKYVKKKGTSYEEVTSNEATHIVVKIDPESFTQGEHELTVTSTQVQPEVKSVIKLTVTAPRQLAQLKMTPQSGVVGINDTLVIKIEPLDQYGKVMMPKASLSARSLDSNIIDLVSKDGQLFEAIEKNGKLSHYELTISGLKKGKAEVEVSSGAIKVKANFEVALSEIVKVTPKDSHTIDVTFNRSVSKLTRDMVEAITTDGKTTLKAKSVVLSPDGMTAIVVFRDRMAKNIDHKLKMVLGGEEDKVEHVYNYKVGAVKSIKMARQTVVQGRKVAYQVFDVNGVDITDDVTVTVNGTNAEHNFVTGQGFIRLAANATGSFTITITAERATTSAVITAESSVAAPRKIAEFWTLATTPAVLLKADYEDVKFVQDTLVTTTTQDKYLQVSLRDQFSNDSELKDGMHLEYTSSADAVLRIDKLTGKLTPVANGRATITSSLMDKDGAAVLDNEGKEIKKTITLAVKSVGVLNEIVLSTNQLQLIKGVEDFKSQIVEVIGKDQYGETIAIDPKAINFEIKGSPSDEAKLEVVEVSKDDNKLTVTGKEAGSAEVVITYGGRMQTLYVHVEEPSKEVVGYKFFNVHDLYFVEEDGKPSTMTPTLYAVDKNNKPVEKRLEDIKLDGQSITVPLDAKELRKQAKTQFTLTATVGGKKIKETFNLIDNRKKPTVHVIDNYLKSQQGENLSEVLLTQLALFDGHGKPIKEIEEIEFYSNNSKVIESSTDEIKSDATGTASIAIESFEVTDSKGEKFVIDMDNEPFTLVIDTTPPEVKAITGTVKQQQAASLTHFGVIFTAVPQGVEGNDVQLAIVQATNRDTQVMPTTVKVEGTKVTLSIGSKKVGDKIEVATKGEVVEALTNHVEASKLLTATTLDKDATASFTLNPAKLKDGKSAVNEVIITYSEALNPTSLGEFSLGDKPATKATKVTPSGDNDILILTFAEPLTITDKETLTVSTPKLKDAVGNEQIKKQEFSVTIKDGKLQLKN